MAFTYNIALVEQPSGDFDIVQDRRVLISDLDYFNAVAYVERIRKPDEKVHVIYLDKPIEEITDSLRVNRRQQRRV